MQEPWSIEKIMEMDEHIGCAMSGLVADAKMLIDHARAETQQHRFTYNEPMPLESVTQSLCDLALRFGEDSEEGEGGLVRSQPIPPKPQLPHPDHPPSPLAEPTLWSGHADRRYGPPLGL